DALPRRGAAPRRPSRDHPRRRDRGARQSARSARGPRRGNPRVPRRRPRRERAAGAARARRSGSRRICRRRERDDPAARAHRDRRAAADPRGGGARVGDPGAHADARGRLHPPHRQHQLKVANPPDRRTTMSATSVAQPLPVPAVRRTRRSSALLTLARLVLGNMAVALVLAALQAIVVVGLSALRGGKFHVTGAGVAWFLAAAVLFTVFMYALAETVAAKVTKEEDFVGATPVIAILPFFFAGALFPISAMPGVPTAIA